MKGIVFDVETTGLPESMKSAIEDSSKWPYVVQLSWIYFDGDTIVPHNYIIKIDGNIPEESTKIHGITNEMSSKGISMKDALLIFTKDFERGDVLVAHNINFDLKLVQVESIRNGIDLDKSNKIQFCTMKYGTKITNIPGRWGLKYPKLIELYTHMFDDSGSDNMSFHNAIIDVLICYRCFVKMTKNKDILEDGAALDIWNSFVNNNIVNSVNSV